MAPATAAERQRKRRAKLKQEGKYGAYKQKHNLEMKQYRKRESEKILKLPQIVQTELKSETKKQVRDRVAKCRSLKKAKQLSKKNYNSPSQVYKSNSALGKAVARAKRGLPNSPHHKEVVVRKLFSSECNVDLITSFKSKNKSCCHAKSLCQDTIIKIQEFYERDDLSRMAPGRKDVVTMWENGNKIKKQARHLICTLKEVFKLFKLEHPSETVGKSKFFGLRPNHILLSSKLPHNVCLCIYHENFINALDVLHMHNDQIPAYSRTFPEEIICKPSSRSCWINECQTCNNAQGFHKAYRLPVTEEVNIKWHYWKKDETNQLSKVEGTGTYLDLHKYLADMIPLFLKHCYIKRQQANSYKTIHDLALTKDFPKDLCVIQVDFSENYTCFYQDEIQSAHWQQNQVSLFTAALYHSGVIHPVVIVSDVLDHSKETVICYISHLLDDIPSNITKVEIWSDGPSSQFKNRFIAASINTLEEKYDVRCKWNYFATSHGKGPVDGIGGTLKRQVFNQVKKRKCSVTNAASFVHAAKSAETTIVVVELTETQIIKRNAALDLQQVWEKAPLLPGIKQYHCIQVLKGKSEGFLLSSDINVDQCDAEEEIKCGDWYEIEYDGNFFRGEVSNLANGEFEVNSMEPVGKNWKWPKPEDKLFYPRSKLIRKLKPPHVINARMHFTFET